MNSHRAMGEQLPWRASLVIALACSLLLSPARSQSPPQEAPLPVVDSSESAALLRLKNSLDNPSALSSWGPNSTPCDPKQQWDGIVCFHGIVTGLRLGGMGLSAGKLDVGGLSNLHGLRTVSFVNNNLSGPIPDLSKLQALKSIYIADNHFSGEIDDDFFSDLPHLKKLWLSHNSFSGKIPASISKLSLLMELHLEDNQFTGQIPGINVPAALASFNVSNNKLQGPIPKSLERFDASAFAGNEGLCGGPKVGGKPCLDELSSTTEDPPVAGDAVTTHSSPPQNVQSSKAPVVFVGLVVSLLALVAGVVAFKRRREGEFDTLGREVIYEEVYVASNSSHKSRHDSSSSRHHQGSSKKGGGSASGKGGGGAGMAELVMVNEAKGVFGLPDLMKAAAEVLGNGGLGSAYKALMSSNGMTVVVKRMREMNRVGKDGFEAQMRRFGRLRHPNVLTPLAYHYRKEEKLLILEYVQKGSLSYLLHGNRGPNPAALDWPTRLKIVKGIARGLAYLHAELGGSDVPHGNLKSGNVLIGPNFEPLLVDYGFIPLINPSQASQTMFAYKSPESLQYRHVSPKSDVYCLGIVVIETLTGKFPSQYLNNGKGGTDVVQWVTSAISERREAELLDPEILGSKAAIGSMERLLRVGAACAEPNPEQRLDMTEALRRIEEISAEREAQEGDGYPELTTRRSAREAVGQLSARRGNDIEFAIS